MDAGAPGSAAHWHGFATRSDGAYFSGSDKGPTRAQTGIAKGAGPSHRPRPCGTSLGELNRDGELTWEQSRAGMSPFLMPARRVGCGPNRCGRNLHKQAPGGNTTTGNAGSEKCDLCP